MNRPELLPLLLEAYQEHRAQIAGLCLALATRPRTNLAAERFVLRRCLRSGEAPPDGALTGPREILWRAWLQSAPGRASERWRVLREVVSEMVDEDAELGLYDRQADLTAGMLRELELADPDPDPARGVAALGWAFRARVVAEMSR